MWEEKPNFTKTLPCQNTIRNNQLTFVRSTWKLIVWNCSPELGQVSVGYLTHNWIGTMKRDTQDNTHLPGYQFWWEPVLLELGYYIYMYLGGHIDNPRSGS